MQFGSCLLTLFLILHAIVRGTSAGMHFCLPKTTTTIGMKMDALHQDIVTLVARPDTSSPAALYESSNFNCSWNLLAKPCSRNSERQLILIGDPSSKDGNMNASPMRYRLSESEFAVYPGLIHGVTLGAK
uniref:CUB domain-containing protein n=1 Tax=Macrostomum lignano TaxID=282301 RepID=A0A1I8IMT6_9PLAT